MNEQIDWERVAKVLVLVGALNWGLAALGYNVVEIVSAFVRQFVDVRRFVGLSLATIIYYIVALSALYLLFNGKYLQ